MLFTNVCGLDAAIIDGMRTGSHLIANPLLSCPAHVQHNRHRALIALRRIGVALWIRFDRHRPADGARLRGSETDRHAALSTLLEEARRQVACFGEIPTARNGEQKAVLDVIVCNRNRLP